jgi:hypothetical protein
MIGAADPNLVVIMFAIVGFIAVGFWRLIVWVRDAPVTPDPWDAETEQQLEAAPEICPHCSTPQPATAWFCEHCGRAVGPYNNLMPYVNVFSEGEVLRNGTHDRLRKSPLILIGYFLISFNYLVTMIAASYISAVLSLAMFAGLLTFWFSVFKNYNRSDANTGNVQS